MKDKRTESLYDCITDVDEQFIQEASEAPEIKSGKKAVWLKWGAMAACLCLVVVSVIALRLQKTPGLQKASGGEAVQPGGMPSTEIIQPGSAPETTQPADTTLTSDPESAGNPEPSDVAAHLENEKDKKFDWNDPPENNGEIWGAMHSHGSFASADTENDQPDFSIKPNLEGFQYAKDPDSYAAPQNGAYVMTDSLKAAVKKYGNQVTYRIHLAIYKDYSKLDSSSAEAQKWFNSLNSDLTVTYLDYFDGSAHSCNFFMDACSYEDLMALCNIESEYGFILSLYCESSGDYSEQAQTSPQIFNAPSMAD